MLRDAFLGDPARLGPADLPHGADRGGGHYRGDRIRPGITRQGGSHLTPQPVSIQVTPPPGQLYRGGHDRWRSERNGVLVRAGPRTEPPAEHLLRLAIALGAIQEGDQLGQPVLVKFWLNVRQELDGAPGTSLVDLDVGPGRDDGRGRR